MELDGPIVGIGGTAPTVSTDAITSITTNSATCGGNVTAPGSDPGGVTTYGVCWSTSPINLTVSDPLPADRTTDGSGLGTYVSYITSLLPGTLYYVKAYASSAFGNGYGVGTTFTTTSSPQDIGARISTDISTQATGLASAVSTDISNQTAILTSAITADISLGNEALSTAVSVNLNNRVIM